MMIFSSIHDNEKSLFITKVERKPPISYWGSTNNIVRSTIDVIIYLFINLFHLLSPFYEPKGGQNFHVMISKVPFHRQCNYSIVWTKRLRPMSTRLQEVEVLVIDISCSHKIKQETKEEWKRYSFFINQLFDDWYITNRMFKKLQLYDLILI